MQAAHQRFDLATVGQLSLLTARATIPLHPRLPHARRHPKTGNADPYEEQHILRPEFTAQGSQGNRRGDRDGDHIRDDQSQPAIPVKRGSLFDAKL